MKLRRLRLKSLNTVLAMIMLVSGSYAKNVEASTQHLEIIPCTSNADARKVPVLGMWLNTYWMEMNKGDTYQFIAYFSPNNATNKQVTWISNNEQVAKVDAHGVVTAVGPGHALIICTSQDNGIPAVAQVVVRN